VRALMLVIVAGVECFSNGALEVASVSDQFVTYLGKGDDHSSA
jgi:hypothetical protein